MVCLIFIFPANKSRRCRFIIFSLLFCVSVIKFHIICAFIHSTLIGLNYDGSSTFDKKRRITQMSLQQHHSPIENNNKSGETGDIMWNKTSDTAVACFFAAGIARYLSLFVSFNFSIDFPPIIFYLGSYYTAIFFYFLSLLELERSTAFALHCWLPLPHITKDDFPTERHPCLYRNSLGSWNPLLGRNDTLISQQSAILFAFSRSKQTKNRWKG